MLHKISHLPLPDPSLLDEADQRMLFKNDEREISNTDWLGRLDYRLRLELVLGEVDRVAQRGALVVDVGSAQGNLAVMLQQRGYRPIATDLRSSFLQYGRLKSPTVYPAIVASGDRLPLRDQVADVVVVGELIEHVAHPDQFLAEANRVLRPGGRAIVTTPNGSHRWNVLPTWTAARTHLSDFEAHQFGPDGGDHLFLYRVDELTDLMDQAGFTDVHVRLFYSDVVARATLRIQSLPGWRALRKSLSPPIAEVLRLVDRTLVRIDPQHRTAQAIVVTARRP